MRFTGLAADLRYAFRLVGADWRFSLTLVGTLAIGIAASGAIFNVVNATLLRPLPIPDEARVYRLQDYTIARDGSQVRRSNRVLNFLAIREEARGVLAGGRDAQPRVVAPRRRHPGAGVGGRSSRRGRSSCWASARRSAACSRRTKNGPGSTRMWWSSATRCGNGSSAAVPTSSAAPSAWRTGWPRWWACSAPASASPTTSRRGCPSAWTPRWKPPWRCSRGSRRAWRRRRRRPSSTRSRPGPRRSGRWSTAASASR